MVYYTNFLNISQVLYFNSYRYRNDHFWQNMHSSIRNLKYFTQEDKLKTLSKNKKSTLSNYDLSNSTKYKPSTLWQILVGEKKG